MRETQIAQYARAVPRYTSYPTAPHFHGGVDAGVFGKWLSALPRDVSLSLYIHIPFCDRMCWFCGCTTKQTQRYAPISTYLESLKAEIVNVSRQLGGVRGVKALHYGGGSPTMLSPEDMRMIDAHLREHFLFESDAEISIEIDPNDMDEARYDALADIGITRVSLGVQDFAEPVQEAINRMQSFEQTKAVVDAMRARGVHSTNLDLLYGLPYQTEASVADTVAQCLTLGPDRIALFGYAHVPWMKKHQKLIDEAILPDANERMAQQTRAAELLRNAGYQAIGIDHFALHDDTLAVAAREGRLKRNFQGYTDDAASVLIGLGASSISELPQGYVQSSPAAGDYAHRIAENGLATVRGVARGLDDRVRAFVIERLMCDFSFSEQGLMAEFGERAEPVIREARELVASEPNGYFVERSGQFEVAPEGRPFVRTFAAHFDTYLSDGVGRHSIAV